MGERIFFIAGTSLRLADFDPNKLCCFDVVEKDIVGNEINKFPASSNETPLSNKTFENKIDDAVHAAMKALGLTVEANTSQADDLSSFLWQQFIHLNLPKLESTQERKTYTVSITRDASVTYTKTFEGTLEELMDRVSRHGFADDDERDWKEDDPSVFDQVESAEILDGDVSLASYDQELGWS